MVKGSDLPDALRGHGLPLIGFDIPTHGASVIVNAEGCKFLGGIKPESRDETAKQGAAQKHQTDQKAGSHLTGGVQTNLPGSHEPGRGEEGFGFDRPAPAEHLGIPDDAHGHQPGCPHQGQIAREQNGDNRKRDDGQDQPESQSKAHPIGHHQRKDPDGDTACGHRHRGDHQRQNQILPAEHPPDLTPGGAQSPQNTDLLPALAQNALHGTGDADAAAEDQRTRQYGSHGDQLHQLPVCPEHFSGGVGLCMFAGNGQSVHSGSQLRAHIAIPPTGQRHAQRNPILQLHHPMDAHPACGEGGLRFTGDQGGKLVQPRSVRHVQMLRFLRQEAHDGEGAHFCHTVHRDDGKLQCIANCLFQLQNLQGRGFQCDLSGVLREPSVGGGEAEQFCADGIVIAEVQTASLNRSGHIGVPQPVEGTQLHELFVIQNFVVQHHHICDADPFLPVMELGIDDAVHTENKGRDQKNRQKHADGEAQVAPLVGAQTGSGHARKGEHLHHITPLSCSI